MFCLGFDQQKKKKQNECNAMQWNEMKWNWMECNAMKWNWMECNGMKWNWMECNGMKWNWMECNAMKWNWMECNGMKWNWMECNGMDDFATTPINIYGYKSQHVLLDLSKKVRKPKPKKKKKKKSISIPLQEVEFLNGCVGLQSFSNGLSTFISNKVVTKKCNVKQ